jgi:anthranilate phosphoribosyltransferase
MPNDLPGLGAELGALITRVSAGERLSAADAEIAFNALMAGEATPVRAASLLTALRVRGETSAEVAGGVRALRRAMIPVHATETAQLVDTCGTGGGTLTTFNISTAAAILAAGAGARIAKHGNRSFSSRCGSADVLEALGVVIELSPAGMAEVLEEAGIVFMFAPLLHPAMRHLAPVRRELGFATIMNLLGPLTNPAGAQRQVVGVSDPALLELIAGALRELGHDRARVVHGEPGVEELMPLGATDVVELRDGALSRYRLVPADDLGWGEFDPRGLAGGGPEENAAIILEVLEGRGPDVARAAVTLNAGAALYLAGISDSIEAGVAEAERALAEGAGLDRLERMREAARRAERH